LLETHTADAAVSGLDVPERVVAANDARTST